MSALPILIAGGGPVGIITALALAQRGVPVRLFEGAAAVNEAPRASTLHPATLEMRHVFTSRCVLHFMPACSSSS